MQKPQKKCILETHLKLRVTMLTNERPLQRSRREEQRNNSARRIQEMRNAARTSKMTTRQAHAKQSPWSNLLQRQHLPEQQQQQQSPQDG
jgi:hypothetical protein